MLFVLYCCPTIMCIQKSDNYFYFMLVLFLHKRKWQQVSSSLQDSSYSDQSQRCYSLDGIDFSVDFHFLQSFLQTFWDRFERNSYNWYYLHRHPHIPRIFFFFCSLARTMSSYIFFLVRRNDKIHQTASSVCLFICLFVCLFLLLLFLVCFFGGVLFCFVLGFFASLFFGGGRWGKVVKSALLAEIRWSVCISKSQIILCIFYRVDSGLCIYHEVVWSNFSILYNSPLVTFSTQLCLLLYFFCESLLHLLIMLSNVSFLLIQPTIAIQLRIINFSFNIIDPYGVVLCCN